MCTTRTNRRDSCTWVGEVLKSVETTIHTVNQMLKLSNKIIQKSSAIRVMREYLFIRSRPKIMYYIILDYFFHIPNNDPAELE